MAFRPNLFANTLYKREYYNSNDLFIQERMLQFK